LYGEVFLRLLGALPLSGHHGGGHRSKEVHEEIAMSILGVTQGLPTWVVWVAVVVASLYVGLLAWQLAGRLTRAVVRKGLLELWFKAEEK
jgi:hypothetical protein